MSHEPSARLRVEPIEPVTTANLRGLCVVDDRTIWASGSGSTVIRSTDGGESWTVMTLPGEMPLDLRDIAALDDRSAVVMSVGEPARILGTTDGGATWDHRYFNASAGVFLDAIAFFDEPDSAAPSRAGLAFGDPLAGRFLVVETSDGGGAWRDLPAESRPLALSGEAAFAASGTCLAARGTRLAWIATGGAAARVLRTDDTGRTWSAAGVPIASGRPSAGVFSVVFFDDRRGVAVGGDYLLPGSRTDAAAVTSDGGRTWRKSRNQPAGYRSCVAVVTTVAGACAAVGTNGVDFSTDFGVSWAPVSSANLNTVAFPSEGGVGWAVGPGGAMARVRTE